MEKKSSTIFRTYGHKGDVINVYHKLSLVITLETWQTKYFSGSLFNDQFIDAILKFILSKKEEEKDFQYTGFRQTFQTLA